MFRSFVFKLLAIIIAAPFLLYFLWKFQIIDLLLFPDSIKTWQIPDSSGAIAFSPNGEMLATPSGPLIRRRLANNFGVQDHPYVEIRRVSDGSRAQTLDFFSTRSLAFSPDNTLIAAGGLGGEINIWRISDGQRLHSLIGSNEPWSRTTVLAFTPDGQTLGAFAVYPTIEETKLNQVSVWNVVNGKKRYILTGKYTGAAISPDGQLLALGSIDKPLMLYRLSDGTLLRQLEPTTTYSSHLNFSPDGKLLAYISRGVGIPVYRMADGKQVHLLSPPTESFSGGEALSDIAISPDGRYLAAAYYALSATDIFGPSIPLASHGRISFWQLDNGQKMQTLRGHKSGVYRLAFHPDGKLLASSGSDGIIRSWQVPPPIAPWPWLLLVSIMLIVLSYFGRSYFYKLRQKSNR